MKKLLLFVLAISFVGVGIAQVSQVSPKAWYKDVKAVKGEKIAEQEITHQVEINPTVSSSRQADIVVGETYYDLQSNSTMPSNRIYAFEDGTISTVWTRGMEVSAYADRGTGYNYFDGTSWGPYPDARIEETRVGWPNIAPYGVNGEINCAHTGGEDGLMFSWRENKGEGDWSYFNLSGPGTGESKELLWPRMITTGENNDVIHVIAVAGNAIVYEDLEMALLYSRSTDGGETWDPENEILEGMGTDYTSGWGGDDYAWAMPVGDNIAFIAFGGLKDGVVMKSINGGDDWERILFYESVVPFYATGDIYPLLGGGDGYNSAVIDDEGMVHVSFGRQVHEGTVDGNMYLPYSDGLIYWNETMAPLDTAIMKNYVWPDDWTASDLYLNGNLAAWVQDTENNDTIVAVAPYYASLSSMPQLVATRDAFGQKIIQIFYSGLTLGFVSEDPQFNYRHIWGRFTEGDGIYSDFTDYTDDIFHLFSECVYPSVAQTTPGDKYHILYETDNFPGNSLQPDPPTHTAVLNNMVYLAVSPLPVDVAENVVASFEVAQNVPNPAVNNTTITVLNETIGSINLSVSNLLGQVVHQESVVESTHQHEFNVNVSNLDSGIYFYTVKIGNNSITKKMLVK
jgi:hypothetical protein